MYAYGCSLGAAILGLYLKYEGERATKILNGAVLYATPWSSRHGSNYFYNNFFGVYQKIISLNLNRMFRTE